MTRTTERWIWTGVVLLLLLTGAVLFLGPAGRMVAMCQETMGGGAMQDSGMRPTQPNNR